MTKLLSGLGAVLEFFSTWDLIGVGKDRLNKSNTGLKPIKQNISGNNRRNGSGL